MNPKKLSGKIQFTICLLTLTEILLFLLCFRSLAIQKKDNTSHIYELGIYTGYGYTGAEIHYDREPVDVTLITPSGKKLKPQYADIYEIDYDTKTITIMEDSNESGLWTIELNKKSNIQVTYSFITKPSDTLYIKNAEITDINGEQYLTFTPVMSTGYTKICQYSVTLSNSKHSFAVANGNALLNKTSYVKIIPQNAAMNGETYDLRLAVKAGDGIMKTSDQETMTVILPEKSENAIENEQKTEPKS